MSAQLHALMLWLKGILLPVAGVRRQLQQAGLEARLPGNSRQLLVDVSVIAQNDARTGIQRVVRALFLQLLKQAPEGLSVRPVFATRHRAYSYAPANFLTRPLADRDDFPATLVSAGPGDIFLGLDLAAHLLPRHEAQLATWKRAGVTVHMVVYDLLPLQHPEWFNASTARNFRRWIRTVAICADSLICISNHVKAETTDYLLRQFKFSPQTLPVTVIPLGSDIRASLPSTGLPENLDQLLGNLRIHHTVLMVGTIEPRKGHAVALSAFEQIWKQGETINLVVVGRPGWKTSTIQSRLRRHAERGKRLHWLENASDELLEQLYALASGLLITSEAEGFGLPLIEAVSHGRPVLARDIPVFRELAAEGVNYFAANSDATQLAKQIQRWLAHSNQCQPTPHRMSSYAWDNSARELVQHLNLNAGESKFSRHYAKVPESSL